jgi:hypothetical protein
LILGEAFFEFMLASVSTRPAGRARLEVSPNFRNQIVRFRTWIALARLGARGRRRRNEGRLGVCPCWDFWKAGHFSTEQGVDVELAREIPARLSYRARLDARTGRCRVELSRGPVHNDIGGFQLDRAVPPGAADGSPRQERAIASFLPQRGEEAQRSGLAPTVDVLSGVAELATKRAIREELDGLFDWAGRGRRC